MWLHSLLPPVGANVSSSFEYCWVSSFNKRLGILDHPKSGSPTAGPGNDLVLLDREIELVTTLVQSLKARRNATLPISILPPEVLVLIFKSYRDNDANFLRGRDLQDAESDCKDTEYHCRKFDAFIPRFLGWLECSRVCQCWRNIISYLGPPLCGAISSSNGNPPG